MALGVQQRGRHRTVYATAHRHNNACHRGLLSDLTA